MRLFIFSLTIGLLCTCTKSVSIVVDPELKIYLDSFQIEAIERGLNYSKALSEISVYFIPLNQNIAGQCQKSAQGHSILIDRNHWSNLNYENREILIFHELGHCILNRIHLDERSAASICISLMRSSSSICRLNYSKDNREIYLNELFSK